MPLYSIHADDRYRSLKFHERQIHAVFGEDIRHQFTVNYAPVAYQARWSVLDVDFHDDGAGLDGDLIPDISTHYGRLFLSQKAYSALKAVLVDHGEFLPVRCEGVDAYLFNPLHKVEEADGLNQSLSVKNEWGDIEHVAFHEARVKPLVIFKTQFDHYTCAYCDELLKTAVEQADLKGLFFSSNLGNPFS